MKTEVDLVTAAGGNIGSMSRCLRRLDVNFRLVDQSNPPDGSRPIVLPGVGAFGAVMQELCKNDFDKNLSKRILEGTPFLGVCVGMQVLFDESEEAPGVPGLGLVSGTVKKYTAGKVPQIGWNKIEAKGRKQNDGFVYFVNSYYAVPANDEVTLYQSDYFGPFCAAIQTNNITAFQFHPEKSGPVGQRLIENWLQEVRN